MARPIVAAASAAYLLCGLDLDSPGRQIAMQQSCFVVPSTIEGNPSTPGYVDQKCTPQSPSTLGEIKDYLELTDLDARPYTGLFDWMVRLLFARPPFPPFPAPCPALARPLVFLFPRPDPGVLVLLRCCPCFRRRPAVRPTPLATATWSAANPKPSPTSTAARTGCPTWSSPRCAPL